MNKTLENILRNKSVLVTGASKGVGKAIVEKLSPYGMKIGLLARSQALLEQLKATVISAGSEAMVLCLDLKSHDAVIQAAEKFKEAFGAPDFLINNAGIGARRLWEDGSLDEELDIMTVNYAAAITLIRYILPDMIKRNSGHIININSIAGIYSSPYQGAYSASKSALLAYVTSLGHELERTGVRVSTLMPGAIDTPFLDGPNYEGFKKDGMILTPQKMADKVLAVIDCPKERVLVAPLLKRVVVKIVCLWPLLFRRIIEKKNEPPKKRSA